MSYIFFICSFQSKQALCPIILFIRNEEEQVILKFVIMISFFFFSGRFHTFKYESNSSGYNCIILSDRHLFHFPGSST